MSFYFATVFRCLVVCSNSANQNCILCGWVERAEVVAGRWPWAAWGISTGGRFPGTWEGTADEFGPVSPIQCNSTGGTWQGKQNAHLFTSTKSQKPLYFTLPRALARCKDIQVYLLLLDFALPTHPQIVHCIRKEFDSDWSYLGSPDFEQCLSKTRLEAVQPVFLLL